MNKVTVTLDGHAVNVPGGITVAAALFNRGTPVGLCGMGTCFQCLVTVDGRPHERACRTVCVDGMNVRTHV